MKLLDKIARVIRAGPGSRNHLFIMALASLWLLTGSLALAADKPVVRVGALKSGTLSWELEVIVRHHLDQTNGIQISEIDTQRAEATETDLREGRVDVILSNWFWVSQQRAAGADWTFVPFSTAVGVLVTPPGTTIRSLPDLKGRRLGVVGTSHDENWLILRLAAQQRYGFDLSEGSTASFGPPAAITERLKAGEIDAALTLWQIAARLEGDGMRRALSVNDVVHELGVSSDVPLLGYVFSEKWARANPSRLEGFLHAAKDANAILATSDTEWDRIAPLIGMHSPAELASVRDAFRAGIPRHWGPAGRADAERLYALLGKSGAEPGTRLAPGTFFDVAPY
ncbi:MAG: ABC transporter substrate-binding protein [Magnetospirillum sp.]|nr:ABC transporter substrate-binding protein [Magnetospirillum sp.]